MAYNSTTVIVPTDFSLTDGATLDLEGTGEVQPGGSTSGVTMTMSGGAFSMAGIMVFQGNTSQILNFSGGAITIGGAGYDGIFSNGGFLNFTPDSTGSLLLTSAANGLQNIIDKNVRYNGVAYTAANYSSVFNVTHPAANQTLITLVPVPEPSVVASLAAGGVFLLLVGRLRRPRS